MDTTGSGRSPAEAGSGCQPSASAASCTASSRSGIPNAFTPGPWQYSATDDERHAVVCPQDTGDDFVGPWFTAIVQCADGEIEDANARLIAAAPDMFHGLLAAEVALRNRDQTTTDALALKAVKLALAKARGEIA